MLRAHLWPSAGIERRHDLVQQSHIEFLVEIQYSLSGVGTLLSAGSIDVIVAHEQHIYLHGRLALIESLGKTCMGADDTCKQHLDVCLVAPWPGSLQWWRSLSLLLCIRASREESSRLTRLSPVHVRIFYYNLHSSHPCSRSTLLFISVASRCRVKRAQLS